MKVSIIVPVYNVELYLGYCLDSLIHQSFEDLEIIVVDDGSTDDSGKIADQYKKLDERIQVIHQRNAGLAGARNRGIDAAAGKYLCFVDSDDMIHRDYVKILLSLCEENTCDIAQCAFIRTGEHKEMELPRDKAARIYSNVEMLDNIYSAMSVETIVAWNKLYKRKLFEGIRFPEGMLHEDEATTYKLIYAAGQIVRTETPLYYYFQNDSGIMRKSYNLKRLDILKAIEQRMSFYREKGLETLYQKDNYKYLCKILIQYYEVCGMPEKNSEVKKELHRKYLKQLKASLNCNWSMKRKLGLMVFGIFPKLYVPLVRKDNY